MEPVTTKTAAARKNSLFINLVCKPDAGYFLLHKKVHGAGLFLIYFNKKAPRSNRDALFLLIDPLSYSANDNFLFLNVTFRQER